MTNHFNKLTPAEAERLAMLAEECGELIQIIGKIQRHGWESWHPVTGEVNRDLFQKEAGDVMAVLDIMEGAKDWRWPTINERSAAIVRKHTYSHHQEDGC